MSEQRDSEARGDDPLTCSKCGGPTKENGRWHPDLGAVYGYELGSAERGPAPDTEEARADDEALNSSDPACEARSEPQADSSTYYCTRPAGHSGQHVAADAHEVVFRWPDTPEVAERPEEPVEATTPAQPDTEGEGVQGDQDCEYGCAGPCFRLDHWRDRAAYWQQAATNLREQLEARAPAPPQPVASEEDFARVRNLLSPGLGVLRYGTADYDALARVLTDARALAQYAKERGERG